MPQWQDVSTVQAFSFGDQSWRDSASGLSSEEAAELRLERKREELRERGDREADIGAKARAVQVQQLMADHDRVVAERLARRTPRPFGVFDD